MGIIKNLIETKFTSLGANKVAADIEHLDRSQTRLGQSSASAGRQFAAQSQGLGGLVGAYAGAAATTFALEAAFTALTNAARTENIVKGTSMLAAEIGQSGPAILSKLQAITQEQINLAETAQNTNLALSAGFNSTQIEKLTVVAQKASTALGRDLSDSFQRLVKGSAKLEPELLDELGIFTRIDPAVKKYAKTLGVSADSLSEFERRQAFVNAVIEEGNRKFASIDTSAPSAQKSLAQLLTQVQNLSVTFTNLINTALGPLVSLFSKDFGNALVLFGAIFLLVFKKAGSIVTAFTTDQLSKANMWATGWITAAEQVSGSYAKLEASQKSFKGRIDDRDGLLGADKSGRFNVAGVDRAAVKRFADIRKEFQSGIIQTLSVQEISQRLKVLDADFEKFGDKLGTIAREDVVKMRQSMVDFTKDTSKGTKLVVGGLGAIKNGLSAVTTIASGAFTAFSWFFAISSVLELLGIDILGAISDKLSEIYKKSNQAKEGFVGLTLSAIGGSSTLVENLKAVGATEEDISKVSDTIKELNKEIQASAQRKFFGGRGGRPVPTAAQARAAELAAARKALVYTQNQISQAMGTGDTAELSSLRQRSEYLKAIIASYETYGKELSLVAGQLSAMSGLSTEEIGKVFSQQDITILNGYIRVFGMAIKTSKDGIADLDSLSQTQKNLLTNYVNVTSAVDNANAAFEAGSATAQTLAAAVTGTASTYQDAKDNAKAYALELINSGVPASMAFAIANEEVNKLGDSLDSLREKAKTLEDLEAVAAGISSAFGGAIATTKDLSFKGLVDSAGKFATSEVEIARNQANLLVDTLNKSLSAKMQYEELLSQGKSVSSEIATAAGNFDLAAKALTGSVIEKYLAIKNAAEQVKSSLASIREEAIQTVQELTAEQPVIKAKFELDISNLQSEATRAAQQQKIDLLRGDLDILSAKKEAGAITGMEAATAENSIQQQILQERRNLIEIEAQISRDTVAQELEIARLQYEQRVAAIDVEAKLLQDKVDAEVKNLQNQISVYDEFLAAYTDANNTLVTGLTSSATEMSRVIASTFTSATQSLAGVLAPFGAGAATAVSAFTANLPELADAAAISADLATTSSAIKLDAAVTKTVIAATAAVQKKAAEEEYDRTVQLAGERLNGIEANAEAQAAALAKATEAEKYLADSRIKAAEGAGGGGGGKDTQAELTEIQKMLTQLFDSIKSNISDALMSLNDLIFYGEGNFGDIMGNLFKSIQQDLFKTTIADPLSDTLTEGIFSIFGIKGGKKGIENARVVNGALQVQVVSGPSDLFGGLFKSKDSKEEDPTGGAFSGFFDKIGGFFSNLFGSDGIISRLFSGLFGQGGILSGLFGGILSLFGFGTAAAQGGLMHLAQGGAAISSTMRRDRIPAMLEPGEFVLRKQAVKSVGVPALQAMNASGKSTNGAPIINITNEGSPKDVQTAQPRFDGEKYVIDIVMRDFANNGPIRRSLRAKGGL